MGTFPSQCGICRPHHHPYPPPTSDWGCLPGSSLQTGTAEPSTWDDAPHKIRGVEGGASSGIESAEAFGSSSGLSTPDGRHL